jgi:Xaa-Pro dipeptidase
MSSSRISKLSTALKTSGVDTLALNAGPSLVYMTGLHFHLSERPVITFFTSGNDPVIVLPELEMLKLNNLSFGVKAFPYGDNPADWEGVFRKTIKFLNLEGKRIGVEPQQMRLLEYRQLKSVAPEAEYPDASKIVSSMRVKKDADEITAMRKAVKVAQSALEATIPLINIGMTEKELSSELVMHLLQDGADSEIPFAPVVSGGPNSANPHAAPSERKLRAGDLLVVDWGAAVDGYISDLTRTFAVGEAEAEFIKIHKIVQEANAAGRAAGKPGAPCDRVDSAARAVIEASGYGKYFTHRTGHGIGMESHEEPYIRSGNMMLLEEGMTYTVEPGIYMPERNGVRIEDNMVVTGNGVESMSDMPREWRVVG